MPSADQRRFIKTAALLAAAVFLFAPWLRGEEHIATAGGPAGKLTGQAAVKSEGYVYRLGGGDKIRVRVLELPAISGQEVLIDSEGDVALPLAGRFPASGMTVAELEQEIRQRLTAYVRDPHVAVTVEEFRSQPVTVFGAVGDPGIHPLQAPTSLTKVLALAGGLREDAGHIVKITRSLERGRIPLPAARDDPSGEFSVTEIAASDLTGAVQPAQNLTILPHDVISVPQAERIYVTGAVHHSGGFLVQEQGGLSVIQALALAGGVTGTAAPRRARILRGSESNSQPARTEILVDVKSILEGKLDDVPLQPDDILFVPKSGGKIAARQAADAAIRVGTGIAIFAGGRR